MNKKYQTFHIILKLYLLTLVIFLFFRVFLLLTQLKNIDFQQEISQLPRMFFTGFRFDTLVISFSLIIPFILLIINDLYNKKSFKKIAFIWTFVAFSIIFMLTAANIVYYNKFSKFIDMQALQWLDDPLTVLGMIFQQFSFAYMIPVFILIDWIFYKLLKRIFYQTNGIYIQSPKKFGAYFFISILLMFLGMRGAIKGHPLRTEDAFLFTNLTLNKSAQNPFFVFEKSLERKVKYDLHPLRLMNDSLAIENLKKYLEVKNSFYKNPIARKIINDSTYSKSQKPKNVVLVFMESLGAWKMKTFGDKENRSPFVDSLFHHSLAFSNMYSSGIHTYVGMYSTNFGYPPIFDRHPMKDIPVKQYYGIPQILKKNGYQTAFFMPGGWHFDNAGEFFMHNAYDLIFFENYYSKDSIKNIWGVDDHFLFNFALKKIDEMDKKNKPFLATILTISDHAPFYIPDFIKGETEKIRASKFADWARKEFFKEAKKKPWFENTIFVFFGDHGQTHRMVYEIPLTYVHIPLIIYNDSIRPEIKNNLTSQLDIMPILMKILNINYINNTLGKNTLENPRKYVIFDFDKYYGILDDEFMLTIDKEKTRNLYKYKTQDTKNYLSEYPEKAKEMETYLKSHLQGTIHILNKDLQGEKGIEKLQGSNTE